MSLTRFALAGAALLTLSACAAGPDFHVKPLPAPEHLAEATPSVATAQAPPDAWWRLYDDPNLDTLVTEALAHNTDLRVAVANLDRARGAVWEARSALLPTTHESAQSGVGRSATANYQAALSGRDAKASHFVTTEADAAYEIDLFGRVRRAIQAVRADAASVEAARDAVRVSVAGETARAYASACALGEQTDVAQRSLKTAQETYEVTLKRAELGSASDLDLVRARAVADSAAAAVPPLDAQRRASLYALAVLTGRPPETDLGPVTSCRTPLTLRQPLPVGDGASLLRRRPDVRQAERAAAADTARIGVAIASFFPQVSLGGTITAGAGHTDNLFNHSSISYAAGPLISWSFPNLIGQGARVAEAKATARASLARFDGVVLTALKETEQALALYAGELQRHDALAAARADYARALDLAKTRYAQGSASFLDVLDAERSLIAADTDLASSDARMSDDQVTLFKALGGGWRTQGERSGG